MDDLIRPRKRFYFIIPVVCAAIGMAAAFAWHSYIVENWRVYTTPCVFPGSHSIEFQETGLYLLLYEYETSLGDKNYSTTRDISELSVDTGLTSRTRAPLDLKSSRFDTTDAATVGNSTVRPVATIRINNPERVQFTAGYRSGKRLPEFVLSIIPRETLVSFLWTGAVAAGFLILGLILAVLSPIVVWRKRKKSRMRLEKQFSTAKRTVF